jgi:hypothetical protein
MITAAPPARVDLEYSVGRNGETDGFFVRKNGNARHAKGIAQFLYLFDKDLSIELQQRRADLFFVHGAVLEHGGEAFVITAPSGTGKSTTAWALVEEGFGYLSDELAPIDPRSGQVHPYPHAVGLKTPPPAPYRLPTETLVTETGMHVPVGLLRGRTVTEPLPVRAIFFLRRLPPAQPPVVHALDVAASAAYLMANALNALAHPGEGLDSAIRIASQATCYALQASDLRATCELVKTTLAPRSGRRRNEGG